MKLSRRRFLALGIAGGALALLVGIPVVRSEEEQVLDALADRLFAGPGLPRPSALEAGRHAWAHAMQMPSALRWQLRGLLRLVEWGPLGWKGARFTRLSEAGQDEVLGWMAEAGPVTPRLALSALKQLCAIGTLRHPDFWAAIGYDGPTIGAAAWEGGG